MTRARHARRPARGPAITTLADAAVHMTRRALDESHYDAADIREAVLDVLVNFLPMARDVAIVCRPAPGLPFVAIPIEGDPDPAEAVAVRLSR